MSERIEYVPHPPDWMLEALCAQTDPDIFFPDKGGSTREAKRVCQRCPVAAECLEHSIEQGERFGIWGGASERDRRKLAGDGWKPFDLKDFIAAPDTGDAA